MNRIFAAMLTALMLGAAPAVAHVVIESSNIEAGGVYDAIPENPIPEYLEIAFNGDVGLAELSLKTAGGETINLDYVRPKEFQAEYVIPLPSLAIGAYVVHWRALAKDGHAMRGKIEFSVK